MEFKRCSRRPTMVLRGLSTGPTFMTSEESVGIYMLVDIGDGHASGRTVIDLSRWKQYYQISISAMVVRV